MRVVKVTVLLLVVAAGLRWASEIDGTVLAQAPGNDVNVVMLDNCSTADPGYNDFGGCPEGGNANWFRGDVSATEFFALLTSPLAPAGSIIGHPSWRNEPSYLTIRARQSVRVINRGGRAHTFTEVDDYGGGFVGLLNGAMIPAANCNPATVTFVEVGGSQQLSGLDPGLRKFQCCIHPWMRAAIRVE